MTFTDEDSQLAYHQAPTLLQMACQFFEDYCYQHHRGVELIDLMDSEVALLGVLDLTDEQCDQIISTMNHQFKRKDGEQTCEKMNNDLGVFRIYVTSAQDLEYLT